MKLFYTLCLTLICLFGFGQEIPRSGFHTPNFTPIPVPQAVERNVELYVTTNPLNLLWKTLPVSVTVKKDGLGFSARVKRYNETALGHRFGQLDVMRSYEFVLSGRDLCFQFMWFPNLGPDISDEGLFSLGLEYENTRLIQQESQIEAIVIRDKSEVTLVGSPQIKEHSYFLNFGFTTNENRIALEAGFAIGASKRSLAIDDYQLDKYDFGEYEGLNAFNWDGIRLAAKAYVRFGLWLIKR